MTALVFKLGQLSFCVTHRNQCINGGRLIMLHVQMGFQSMCDSSAMATGHHLSASHQGKNPSLLEADQQYWFSQLFPSLSWKETVVSHSVKWWFKTCHKEVTEDILLLLLMFLVFCDVNWMVYSVCYHVKKCIKLSVIRTWTQQLWHSFKSSMWCYSAYKRRLCKMLLGFSFFFFFRKTSVLLNEAYWIL